MSESTFNIPGVVLAGTTAPEPPIILVEGREKCGKSTATISLFDWPNPGDRPLALAFDPTGVEVCLQLGYQVPHIKIKDQPGVTFAQKTQAALQNVEMAFNQRRGRGGLPTSIVVDCASTMTDKFMQEASAKKTNKLQAYGEVLEMSKQVMWRLIDIGVPTIWLAWLKEPFVEEKGSGQQKTRRTVLGGPLITGNFKGTIAGKATQILFLDKYKVGEGQPGADAQGYARQFHTRTFDNIECGGRYTQFLPEPCPVNLGYILTQIMYGPRALMAQQQAQQAQGVAQAPAAAEWGSPANGQQPAGAGWGAVAPTVSQQHTGPGWR